MKTIYKITYFVLAAGLLAVMNVGCAKIGDFGKTNVDPNGSSTVATGTFIATVQARLGSGTYGTADPTATTLSGFFCQYFAQPTYPVASRYSNPQVNSVGIYAGVLQDCKIIIDRNTNAATMAAAAASGSNVNQIAIARIMKAYIFWDLTDKYGDIPYSQALQGVGNLTPKYDKQSDIYPDLIKECTEAGAQMDAGGVIVQGDLIYGGSTAATQVAKWKKFANSLRMLMALRLSKRFPAAGAYAATQFSLAYNDAAGHIITNADNFALNYLGGSVNLNNPWNATGGSADNGESETMTKATSNLGDTRAGVFGSNATGVPYGCAAPANTAINYAKILSAPFKAATGLVVFIGASNVLLAEADAFEMGWVTGKTTVNAEASYNAGVNASFAQWGLTVPGSYLTGSANYNTGAGGGSIGGACTVAGSSAATATKLQRIALQQWLAWYPNATQGWSNWRRTGFPVLMPSSQSTNPGGQIPRRYTFGASEYSLNLAQVTAAAAAMGGDTQDTKVWWDQ
jgi:hypothetical protein